MNQEKHLLNILSKSDAALLVVDEKLNLLFSNKGFWGLMKDSSFTSVKNLNEILNDHGALLPLRETIEGFFSNKDQSIDTRISLNNNVFRLFAEKIKLPEDKAVAVLHFKEEEDMAILYNIMNESMDGFDIVDDRGMFVYVNDAYLGMWGYSSREEVIGTSPVAHCADEKQAYKMIDIVNTQGNSRFQFKAKRKDGSLFDVLMHISKYTDSNGRAYYSGFSRDITERLAQEAELKRKQEELLKTEKQRGMLELMQNFAHRINTPLGASISMVSLLQDIQGKNIDSDEEMIKHALDLLAQSNKSLKEVADSLLYLLSLHDQVPNDEINVKSALEYAVSQITTAYSERSIGVDLNIPEDFTYIHSQDMFIEFLNSLLQFSLEQDNNSPLKIEIIVRREQDHIKITMIDYNNRFSRDVLKALESDLSLQFYSFTQSIKLYLATDIVRRGFGGILLGDVDDSDRLTLTAKLPIK